MVAGFIFIVLIVAGICAFASKGGAAPPRPQQPQAFHGYLDGAEHDKADMDILLDDPVYAALMDGSADAYDADDSDLLDDGAFGDEFGE